LKIVSPYEIKELNTIDLLYKQYKMLGMKKWYIDILLALYS
jgi:hypothetical protein